jgi:uncharacterized membrane protein HdeD (DUF308 family)
MMPRAKSVGAQRLAFDGTADRPILAALIRNRWMIAARGGVAILFGLALLRWPPVTLPVVVTLFGLYAVIDGGLALAAAFRTDARLRHVWPVALEGTVSVVVGIVALLWPLRVSHDLIQVLVTWGVATGVLEFLAALHVSWKRASHWLLLTGGLSSLFLAIMIALLPYADVARTVEIIGVYALVFGALMAAAAYAFPGDEPMYREILSRKGGRR